MKFEAIEIWNETNKLWREQNLNSEFGNATMGKQISILTDMVRDKMDLEDDEVIDTIIEEAVRHSWEKFLQVESRSIFNFIREAFHDLIMESFFQQATKSEKQRMISDELGIRMEVDADKEAIIEIFFELL
jgi:hypothetical protein